MSSKTLGLPEGVAADVLNAFGAITNAPVTSADVAAAPAPVNANGTPIRPLI